MLIVVEILASSKASWEVAAANAVKEASKAVRGIRGMNVQNQCAVIGNGKITFGVKQSIATLYSSSIECRATSYIRTNATLDQLFDPKNGEKDDDRQEGYQEAPAPLVVSEADERRVSERHWITRPSASLLASAKHRVTRADTARSSSETKILWRSRTMVGAGCTARSSVAWSGRATR